MPSAISCGIAGHAAAGAGGHDGDVEDAMAMAVLGDREALHAARRVARQHHRHLVVQRQHLFQHARLVLQLAKRQQGLVTAGDPDLALAVIAEAGHLEDAGKQAGVCLRDVGSLRMSA
jgi:hypothetical protein